MKTIFDRDATELLLHRIVESVPIRIFWKDRDSFLLGCNTLFAKDAGSNSPKELIGKSDFDMPWKDQAELYRTDDQKVMKSGLPILNIEEPQTTPEGNTIWLRTSKVPLKDAADRVIGILGIYDDITERKRAVGEIKRLASFPKLNPDPIIELDTSGVISFLNPVAEKLFPDLTAKAVSHPLLKGTTEAIAGLQRDIRLKQIIQEVKIGAVTYELHITHIPEFRVTRIYIHDITQRKQSEEEIYLLATTDSLTRISNRRAFTGVLEKEVTRAIRYNFPVCLVMYDIDHFKRVNDTFGHDTGDAVLQTMTDLVKNNIRTSDTVARWGGEEFMLLLPQSDIDTARQIAEKLRQKIAGHHFDKVGQITVSFGLTMLGPHDDMTSLLKRVDDTLYHAKESGRNRVEVCLPE